LILGLGIIALIFWLLLDQAKSDIEKPKINHNDMTNPRLKNKKKYYSLDFFITFLHQGKKLSEEKVKSKVEILLKINRNNYKTN
jgi:hypothetical protein